MWYICNADQLSLYGELAGENKHRRVDPTVTARVKTQLTKMCIKNSSSSILCRLAAIHNSLTLGDFTL